MYNIHNLGIYAWMTSLIYRLRKGFFIIIAVLILVNLKFGEAGFPDNDLCLYGQDDPLIAAYCQRMGVRTVSGMYASTYVFLRSTLVAGRNLVYLHTSSQVVAFTEVWNFYDAL